jgi:peptidoglycan/xylan/chitin deacetylase (PgdA/CDA1 family)
MPSTLSHGDFGPQVAVPRILELLRKYEVPASFYVPGWIGERFSEQIATIVEGGHEISHHGYLHEPPATLTRKQEAEVLDRGIKILQSITDERPRGYRSPSWELSEHSLELLAERDFVYDSSLMGDDAPYLVTVPDGRELVEIPVHWSLDDAPFMIFNQAVNRTNVTASPAQLYDVWKSAFDELFERGRAFVLTMHPWIISRAGRLMMLERLLDHMRERPSVIFQRSIDVATTFSEH